MPAIDCPLTSCVCSHEKLWEEFSVHRKERADTPEDSYWKKFCVAVCKGFLIFTYVFNAVIAQVLPEQERILSHTSVWMSLKQDFSNYSIIPRWVIYLFTVNYNSSSLAWHPPSAHKHCKPELLLCVLH